MNLKQLHEGNQPIEFTVTSGAENEKAFLEFCEAHKGKVAEFHPDDYYCITGLISSEIEGDGWTANLNQGETYDVVIGTIVRVLKNYMSHAGDEGPAVEVNDFKPRVHVEVMSFNDEGDDEERSYKVSSGILHYTQLKKIVLKG